MAQIINYCRTHC